ncbi:hypothetical protein G7054_g1880 [Neopestalotiopsis clavispora]|nr:hypothetical protein G7054_g1880 [Neopestalotiopsis clavispora]
MEYLLPVLALFICASSATFTYTAIGTERYATPLRGPLATKTAFAPPFAQASTLLPTQAIHTTYSYQPETVLSDDGSYGQSAYNALWAEANLTYASTMPFSTTMSATPIPSSELVFPPELPIPKQETTYTLPDDFIWGVSSSAWQIEGALQAEGRGPAPVVDRNGDLSSNSQTDDGVTTTMNYYLYKQDLMRLAALGVPYYSFSISWSRILPFGIAGSPVNQQAIDHYDDLINTCLQYGITPIPTLWHFDAPMLVDFDDESMIEHFIYYAKIVMTHYADRIPIWQTFNEPNVGFLYLFKDYNTISRITLAHAEVYHWYKEELKGTGKISFKFANNLAYPLNGPANDTDVAAALRYQNIVLGLMGNPLFLGKQIPDDVLNTPGLNVSALADEQLARVNGTVDFLSIDPYSAQLATAPPGGLDACIANSSDANWPFCVVLSDTRPDGWLIGAASNSFVHIAPQYVRQQLKYLWDTFKPAGGIMVTEFGFPVKNEQLKDLSQQRFDLERSIYYYNFLSEMLKAMYEDGLKVIGTLAWSVMDNNEWGDNSQQYGLQTMNRTDGFKRTYKRSFFDFLDFFQGHMKPVQGCDS